MVHLEIILPFIGLFLVILNHVDSLPWNEYQYSLERDQIVQDEKGFQPNRLKLNQVPYNTNNCIGFQIFIIRKRFLNKNIVVFICNKDETTRCKLMHKYHSNVTTLIHSQHVPKLRYTVRNPKIDPSPTFHKITQA